MAQVLKVGSFDFSKYVRVAHEDGLDPANPEHVEPQFTGSPAFSEGQTFVGDAVSNRLMTYPLILSAANTDALYALIREAKAQLIRGAQVEYASGGAGASTFFDLEAGRLEPKFEFWLDQAARARATLHLWVRPFGTTGTTRAIASIAMGSAAVAQFSATGVVGDEPALANLEVRVGSSVATNGRVVLWGQHPHPSFNGIHVPTSSLAQSGATVRGASGAVGSQYVAIPVSPTGASGIAYTAYLGPPEAHVGRHRVFAIARSGLTAPIPLFAEDRFGAVLGPTALATQTDINKWQLLDLGEIQVPSRIAGQEPVPTQFVNIVGGGASGVGINASPAFHLSRLIFLPLDISAGVLRTPGALKSDAFEDSFSRLNYFVDLSDQPAADSGQSWSHLAGGGPLAPAIGTIGIGPFSETKRVVPVASKLAGGAHLLGPNASGLAALGSGAALSDVVGMVDVGLTAPSGIATGQTPSAAVVFYPNGLTNASTIIGGVGVKLQFGPSQTLQIFGASSNGATAVLASAGIATTLASGLFVGQKHTLTVRVQNSHIDVWVATGALSPSPVLSASHALAAGAGWPVLGLNAGSNVASGVIYADSLFVAPITGASDIGAREYFRFESYPRKRVIQGNASVFKADRTAQHRGHPPELAPVGSPAPTGPAQVIVFQGEIDNVIGNDGFDAVLGVRERFSYLR